MAEIKDASITPKYSQTQGYGMVPVYEQQGGRAGERGEPVFLGYQFSPAAAGLTVEDVPKPANVLAYEKQFGTTMEPIYATYDKPDLPAIPYGPPTGYRFDNGKSQYVNFDASGTYQNTETRSSVRDQFAGIALSMLSIAYPPAAPFIQAYRAVEAIDKGDTLAFILNAAGAGAKIPGLDANTSKLLTNVSTGAKIVQAVESKDPLKILSATSGIPGVDPDIKDLSIILNTGNALKNGDIAGAINGIAKMSDRDSVGRLTDKFNDIVNGGDVAAIDPSQVAAFNPPTDENIDDTLTNAGLVRSDVIDKTPEEQEQEDREQAAREAIRVSERNIEDTLIDAGLVTDTNGVQALTPVDVTGTKITDDGLDITGTTGNNRITDSGLPVNPNVGTPTPALAPVTVTTKAPQENDLPITTDTGGNRVTDSSVPVNPNVGEPPQELKPVTIVGKREPPQELEPVTIVGKKEEPVVPKIPVIPKVPTTPAKPTPAKPAPAKTATPEEQFYQTTTQSNPTTLADIKYYLDMASGGMVPPENSPDPLESLLNQPMSVEELLYHLRS